MPNARMYLRASTTEQDATRAEKALRTFADERGLVVVSTYLEHESGASLVRPKLFRLLADANVGDVLLVEQVDRLSRLNECDWRKLRSLIEAKGIRVVALDLPTSWMMTCEDEFTSRMFGAINALMMDMLAAVARKDYADRRRRQAEGIANAKARRVYAGRPENTKRNATIAKLLKGGASWSEIMATVGCCRATVARIAAQVAARG